MGSMVQFDTAGGKTSAYLAVPEGGNGRGILLCHAWWGLNDFFKATADRLAGQGYTVLAPDLFDGSVASTVEEAQAQIGTVEKDGGATAIQRELGALDYLLGLPSVGRSTADGAGAAGGEARVAAIGFSMGAAYCSWLSTRRPEIAAVVLFYGGVWTGSSSGSYPELTEAALQAHLAPNDEWEPEEPIHEVEADMKAAGHTMELYVYPGTKHWFFETDRPQFEPAAAQQAWDRTLAFLKRYLG